jgi:hypothetical protein
MSYALNSGENLLFSFALIDLPTGVTWKGIYDNTVAYVVNDAVLGSDNIGYKCILASTGHAPPNATYWSVLPTIPASQIVGVVVELVDATKVAKVTYTYARSAGVTAGLLIPGSTYIITHFNTGDDFTNVGAASNATNVTFVATGTTPTDWTHGSTLQQMVFPPNIVLSDGLLQVELLKGDTLLLDGDYELRVTMSFAAAMYIQSGAQTDVLCLPEAMTITPC